MQLVIDIDENVFTRLFDNGMEDYEITNDDLCAIAKAIRKGIPIPKGHGRKFESIVVEYPPAESCTYPEYRGKPYFSIKYKENGEHIIGFGTYKPEVLSRYLQEYFIAPTIIEADTESGNNNE